MSKFVPAREGGDKPYVITSSSWGRTTTRIGWGKTPTEARWDAFGRMGVAEYITGTRRATLEDMPADQSGDDDEV